MIDPHDYIVVATEHSLTICLRGNTALDELAQFNACVLDFWQREKKWPRKVEVHDSRYQRFILDNSFHEVVHQKIEVVFK